MQFVDRVQVKVKGGRGGNGCASFRREKYVAKGGPDGGDGGAGGAVIFEATEDEQHLIALKYMNHFEGGSGLHGSGKHQVGRRGEDVIIKVPLGTIIRDLSNPDVVVADLDDNGDRYLAVQGGRGGWGNIHFMSSINRAPRECENGIEGEELELDLELKLIADAGLVGFPNAGKSTLLGALTNAEPETASYPFTTLTPNVGIMEFDDFARMTIADIPGLVDGAHENVGLGHDFLRHIERTRVLVYVLDMAGTDGRSPLDDLQHLRHELECYQEGLSTRQSIIIANKMDEAASAENLELLKATTDVPVLPVCAILEEGLAEIRKELRTIAPVQAK